MAETQGDRVRSRNWREAGLVLAVLLLSATVLILLVTRPKPVSPMLSCPQPVCASPPAPSSPPLPCTCGHECGQVLTKLQTWMDASAKSSAKAAEPRKPTRSEHSKDAKASTDKVVPPSGDKPGSSTPPSKEIPETYRGPIRIDGSAGHNPPTDTSLLEKKVIDTGPLERRTREGPPPK